MKRITFVQGTVLVFLALGHPVQGTLFHTLDKWDFNPNAPDPPYDEIKPDVTGGDQRPDSVMTAPADSQYVPGPTGSGRSGEMNINSDPVTFTVFNADRATMKLFQVELVYRFPNDPAGRLPLPTVAGSDGVAFAPHGNPPFDDNPIENTGWRRFRASWTRQLCPMFETMTIRATDVGFPLSLDYIRIDTDCLAVPEPGMISLLAFGSLLVVGRRGAR